MRDLAPIPDGGPLLAQRNPSRIFKAIEREIEAQDPLRRNREEQEKHWNLVLDGCQFSILEKSEDQSVYKQLFVPGAPETPLPIPNKVADLKRKIISQVLADTFLPDPKPDGADSDRNRGAADVTKKALRQNALASGINEKLMLRESLDLLMTGKSAFQWFWVDDYAGGWRPMQKLAHPQAEDANNPLVGPKLGPDGQPITLPDGTVITERSTDPILRYVTEDGQFTEDPAAAARQWMPKILRETLRPSQLCTFPATATVPKARKVTVLAWAFLGDAKKRFPILRGLSDGQVRELCRWRPKRWQALIPDAMRPKGNQVRVDADGVVADDNLIFWYHHFCRISEDYPDGADIAITGGTAGGAAKGFLLRRDTLREDVEADDGTTVPILMDPPVAQFKGYNDVAHGDPFGMACLSEFGGSYELFAHIYMAVLEAIDKGLHPNVYIPSTSPVSRADYLRRDGTPIPVLTKDDAPTIEDPPQIPSFTPQILDKLDTGMNSAAGTNETSNGLDSSYSQSGIAKDVAIRQAKVSLMQLWENTVDGEQQVWRINHQLMMARYTVPQEVMLSGVESAFKQKWFVGSDLLGVREIPLANGTGTMQSPMEKLQLLQGMVNAGFLEKEAAGEMARTTMTDDLGLDPNPHEEFADRCVGAWIEGPPDGWLEQFEQNQQIQQQRTGAIQQQVAQLVMSGQAPDQQTAQQQAEQQVPPAQVAPLWDPFTPRAHDAEPGVARIFVTKLSRLLSSPDYEKWPPEWQQLADQAYNRAFYNSGGQTVAQQAQAAQANAKGANAGGDDATFGEFVQKTEQSVLALVRTEIAKAVAAQYGAGAGAQQPADDGSAAAQATAQADLAARTHEATVGALSAANEGAAQRAHEAQQAALQRAHEARENAADRTAKTSTTMAQAALSARVKAQQGAAQLAQRERQLSMQREAAPPQPGGVVPMSPPTGSPTLT